MTNRNKFKLRPLEQELRQAERTTHAGYHDMHKPVVDIRSWNSAVTTKHERLHDELFMHSTFGGFQKDVALVASLFSPSSEYRSVFENWKQISLDESRIAHETYATFLSIKSFPPDKEQYLLGRHPREYQTYFNHLSSVIDSDCGSSFLQYLVAKSLVTCAFWGRIRARVVTQKEILNPKVLPEESPDLRLYNLLENFETKLSDPIFAAIDQSVEELIIKGVLPKGFRAQSEADWTALPYQQSDSADRYLMPRIREAIFRAASTQLKLSMSSWEHTGVVDAEKFFAAVNEFTEVSIELKPAEVAKDLHTAEDNVEKLRRGNIKIENPFVRIPDQLNHIDSFSQLDEYLQPGNVAISTKYHTANDDIDWRVVVFTGTDSALFSLDDSTFMRALNLHRPVRLGEGRQNVIETVVVGVRSLDDFESLYDRYEDTFLHSEHVSRFPTIFWYTGGNFSEWFEWIGSDHQSCRYVLTIIGDDLSADVAKAFLEGRESPQLLNSPELPPRLIVTRNSYHVGYFVRLIPGFEAMKALGEEPLSNLTRFSEEERLYLKHSTNKILKGMYSVWKWL